MTAPARARPNRTPCSASRCGSAGSSSRRFCDCSRDVADRERRRGSPREPRAVLVATWHRASSARVSLPQSTRRDSVIASRATATASKRCCSDRLRSVARGLVVARRTHGAQGMIDAWKERPAARILCNGPRRSRAPVQARRGRGGARDGMKIRPIGIAAHPRSASELGSRLPGRCRSRASSRLPAAADDCRRCRRRRRLRRHAPATRARLETAQRRADELGALAFADARRRCRRSDADVGVIEQAAFSSRSQRCLDLGDGAGRERAGARLRRRRRSRARATISFTTGNAARVPDSSPCRDRPAAALRADCSPSRRTHRDRDAARFARARSFDQREHGRVQRAEQVRDRLVARSTAACTASGRWCRR